MIIFSRKIVMPKKKLLNARTKIDLLKGKALAIVGRLSAE